MQNSHSLLLSIFPSVARNQGNHGDDVYQWSDTCSHRQRWANSVLGPNTNTNDLTKMTEYEYE